MNKKKNGIQGPLVNPEHGLSGILFNPDEVFSLNNFPHHTLNVLYFA
jgi:hypothetical protein